MVVTNVYSCCGDKCYVEVMASFRSLHIMLCALTVLITLTCTTLLQLWCCFFFATFVFVYGRCFCNSILRFSVVVTAHTMPSFVPLTIMSGHPLSSSSSLSSSVLVISFLFSVVRSACFLMSRKHLHLFP